MALLFLIQLFFCALQDSVKENLVNVTDHGSKIE